jgi:predicted nucleotidyltransferase
MLRIETLLEVLTKAEVDFIIVGGVAAIAHGSSRLTQDLDIVYRRTPENTARLASALASYSPYLRDAPPGLPFRWDAETIRRGLNFTLTTSLGPLDILGEIAGGGTYEELFPHSKPVSVFGTHCLCLGLDRLILAKRAAGRPKDLEAIAELEALNEERGKRDAG